jgi:thymidylate synthase
MSHQYKNLLSHILMNGEVKSDRTGEGTKSVFATEMTFDLSEGFPVDTLRKVAFRIAFEETMFFLRGENDTTKLEDKKINIWKGNTSREFLDKVGLNHLPVGDLGRAYGVQWRNWRSVRTTTHESGIVNWFARKFGFETCEVTYTDQLVELLNGLKNDPNGRRHIITAWNPGELKQMALPPCHLYQQYYVRDGKLDSMWVQRSVDSVYGLPYNVMSYAFLNVIFAKLLGLEPGNLTFKGGDTHIYLNQMFMAEDMVANRDPKPFPKIEILKEINDLDDILSLEFSDIKLHGYDAHPDYKDKPAMAV